MSAGEFYTIFELSGRGCARLAAGI